MTRSDSDVEDLIRRAGSRPTPDADRAARVRAAVEREWRAQAGARRTRRWAGGVALVVLLGAAAAVFFAVRPRSTVPPPVSVLTPIATVAAAHGTVTMTSDIAGGRATVAAVGRTIAAGSTIRTTGASRATVTLNFGGELRIDVNTVATIVDAHTIQLERGAIYLDSGASTPGRFTVRTASGTIRDIGTRFEVRADLLLSIKVRDGAVQLERAGRIDRALEGTELVARADGSVSTRSVDRFADGWAWTTAAAPTFVVEDATLEAFLQWAAREGGWTLEMDTMDGADAFRQRARATILHGAIDGMTPADALNAVLPTCGLSPRIVNGRLRLRPL